MWSASKLSLFIQQFLLPLNETVPTSDLHPIDYSSQMARVVKVPSLHFLVFNCQVFFGSSIHQCTSLNLILDRNLCGSYLNQSFAGFHSSEKSCLSREITGFIFVAKRQVHFVQFLLINVIHPISNDIQATHNIYSC